MPARDLDVNSMVATSGGRDARERKRLTPQVPHVPLGVMILRMDILILMAIVINLFGRGCDIQ